MSDLALAFLSAGLTGVVIGLVELGIFMRKRRKNKLDVNDSVDGPDWAKDTLRQIKDMK